jgi:hypothetical protein
VTHAIHKQIENQKEKEEKGVREDNNSRSKTRRGKDGHGKAVAAPEAVTPTMVKAAAWH